MAHAVEATEPGYVVRTRDVHRTDRRGQVLALVLRGVNREDQRGGVLRRPERPVAAAETDVTPGERVTVRQDFSTPSSGGQVNAAAVVIVPATASTPSGGGG